MRLLKPIKPPKIPIQFLIRRTWPTPTKSELFRNRKERNVVKTSFEEIDLSICNDQAITVDKVNWQVSPCVGEQSQEYDFTLQAHI